MSIPLKDKVPSTRNRENHVIHYSKSSLLLHLLSPKRKSIGLHSLFLVLYDICIYVVLSSWRKILVKNWSLRLNVIVMGCLIICHLRCRSREFSNERVRVERREKYRKEKMHRDFTQGFTAYFDWVSKAGCNLLHQLLHHGHLGSANCCALVIYQHFLTLNLDP